MLSSATIATITKEALNYWKAEVKKPEIIGIAKGKEIGHKLADLVDEKTTALLTVNHLTKHQRDAKGQKRSRSMGDLWLHNDGIYHPVNVKTGIVGAEGQPNLVSLKKVMTAITSRQIDSYYLLIVKLQIGSSAIVPSVYFIDMLDWLDYVTFDSGPGQMMLKAKRFFDEYGQHTVAQADIKAKLARLMDLYLDGERRLKENRESDLEQYTKHFKAFMSECDLSVTQQTQRSLNLE